MEKINRKRLNNKGFTLIELLAVVVILAVVMGIAMNTVLSSMNKARAGSLSDSALIVANGFNQKYTESLVDGVPTSVYKGTNGTAFEGYNFSADATVYLDKLLADEFNISGSTYVLHDDAVTVSDNVASHVIVPTTGINTSFVNFDAVSGKFVVCLVAKKTGNNYVAANVTDTTKRSVKLDGTTYTFADGEMFACSDGTKSW